MSNITAETMYFYSGRLSYLVNQLKVNINDAFAYYEDATQSKL